MTATWLGQNQMCQMQDQNSKFTEQWFDCFLGIFCNPVYSRCEVIITLKMFSSVITWCWITLTDSLIHFIYLWPFFAKANSRQWSDRSYSSHYISVHMADSDSIFDLPFFIGTLLPNAGRPYYVAECFNSVEKSANYEEACHCKDKGKEGPAMFYLWRLNRIWLHTCQWSP